MSEQSGEALGRRRAPASGVGPQHVMRGECIGVPQTRTASRPMDASALAAASVLRVLTSSAYRKGSLERMDFKRVAPSLLSTLCRRTRAGAPVQLTLMAFPFKVPNPAKTGARALPDLAELSAIRRLLALATGVSKVYPPGLQVEIIHDGSYIADVFGVDLDEVRAYETYFARLIATSSATSVIRCHDFGQLQQRAGFELDPAVERLEQSALQWWDQTRDTPSWRDCFRKTLGMLSTRDLPMAPAARVLKAGTRGGLPAEFRELETRVHRAMIGYRVKDALIHQFDPRPVAFPDAIHATTRVQPNRLALWLVRRGNGLLPWHGVGTLDDRGRVRVMLAREAGRRPELRPLYLLGETTPFCFSAMSLPTDLLRIVTG